MMGEEDMRMLVGGANTIQQPGGRVMQLRGEEQPSRVEEYRGDKQHPSGWIVRQYMYVKREENVGLKQLGVMLNLPQVVNSESPTNWITSPNPILHTHSMTMFHVTSLS